MEPSVEGLVGDTPPFHMPVFVLTHHFREPLAMKGGTTFHFVTDGIQAALQQARRVAGGKDVLIGGGARVVQQYLAAGLVDEMTVSVVPIFLGGGERLYDSVGGPDRRLEQVRVVEAGAGSGASTLPGGEELFMKGKYREKSSFGPPDPLLAPGGRARGGALAGVSRETTHQGAQPRYGASSRTIVPLPGVLLTTNLAPTLVARSRIPTSPKCPASVISPWWGTRPRPSSLTDRRTLRVPNLTESFTPRACACFSTFVIAS
jgi:dihydrofolate reductase